VQEAKDTLAILHSREDSGERLTTSASIAHRPIEQPDQGRGALTRRTCKAWKS
jgi:hypothetical protein